MPDEFQRRRGEFDREWDRTTRGMFAWFVFVALVIAAVVGVGVWGVIQLIEWITTK